MSDESLQKQLTDEDAALAFGWELKDGRWHPPENNKQWTTLRFPWGEPPKYTTNLNYIVQEVDRRDLDFTLRRYRLNQRCDPTAEVWKTMEEKSFYGVGDTLPLALCEALMAYLEDQSNG